MIRETVSHLRDLPRYGEILATLIRYGYRDVVTALHLEGLVRPIERAALGEDAPAHDRPRRLRLICEDLGPTFVKLGQLLSTRQDLLPEAYTIELAALRDDVRPFPYEEVEEILKEEFGRPATEVFRSIEREPVASASISQVHRAVLPDGREVALKIRRPGIEKVVQADLDLLRNLALLGERRLPNLATYHPVGLVQEFERTLKRELDLNIERRTMERCRTQLADMKEAHVPEVYPEFSTGAVLCMEFIDGVGVDDLEGMRRLAIDPAMVAKRGADILLSQIFKYGFFHADPHPGNLRVLPGGVVAPLDYGMFGQLDARARERIADLLMGLLAEDTERVLRALDALDIRGDHADPKALERDVGELVAAYADLTLDTIDLGQLLRELVGLIRSHHLRIPPDLVLLIRSLVTIESVGRCLDPHFDIAARLQPFLRDLTLRRMHPVRLLGRAARTAEDLQKIATILPDVLGQSLESIRRGELNVRFDVQHFDSLVRQLTRASHTLAAAIIVAGLLVGSSMIVQSGPPMGTVGAAGYAVAGGLGFWLLVNILRGR
jgi:ubiquinone biosynthesis protein